MAENVNLSTDSFTVIQTYAKKLEWISQELFSKYIFTVGGKFQWLILAALSNNWILFYITELILVGCSQSLLAECKRS